MSVAALFASHTPLKDYHAPTDDVAEKVDAELKRLANWVASFDPQLVIAVGPDHYNGFFYNLMPSFCIGTEATSVGDWNTPAGALNVNADAADRCVRALHVAGVDVALSHRMNVDHGVTQLLHQLFDWQSMPPVIPLFINCAAPPLPPMNRVLALGTALGEFAAAESSRVLITASGGLSHDPPIPELATASEPVRERLIAGGSLDADARAARQQRVLDDAKAQLDGTSERTPLNPQWDQTILDALCNADHEFICAMSDAEITRDGGCGGHEIRPWLAVAAAARVAGASQFEQHYYRAIPEWIAGYGLMTAAPP